MKSLFRKMKERGHLNKEREQRLMMKLRQTTVTKLIVKTLLWGVPVCIVMNIALDTTSTGGFSLQALILLDVPMNLELLCLFVGLMLVLKGRTWREGVTRHCAKCNYQKAPEGQVSELCPECGAEWLLEDGLAKGNWRNYPPVFWTGVALCSLFVICQVANRFVPYSVRLSRIAELMPTGVLIAMATDSDYAQEVMAILAERTLAQEQINGLAEGLMDARLEKPYLFNMEQPVFRKIIANGVLPEELHNRYYREMLDTWVYAPDQVEVGEAFEIKINAQGRFTPRIDEVVSLYVTGYQIGDSPGWVLHQSQVLNGTNWAEQYDNKWTQRVVPESKIAWTATEAGELKIRFVYWMVVHPQAITFESISWDENDVPKIPEGVYWSQRIQVEKVVEVLDDETSQ